MQRGAEYKPLVFIAMVAVVIYLLTMFEERQELLLLTALTFCLGFANRRETKPVAQKKQALRTKSLAAEGGGEGTQASPSELLDALKEERRKRRWEADIRTLEHARKEGVDTKASSYLKVMSACNRCCDKDMAAYIFGLILENGVVHDFQSRSIFPASSFFQFVAESFDDERLRESGLQLLEAFQAFGLGPSKDVQNSVVRAWQLKPPEHVVEFFIKMKESGTTLGGLADRCIRETCLRPDPERTLKLYDSIVEQGRNVDLSTFNEALLAHCRLGRPQNALELSEQMPSHSLTPSAKTYGVLIEACTKLKKFGDAMNLFNTMRDEGYEPNCYNYEDLILCCIRRKKISKAIWLYHDMLQTNVAVPLNTKIHHNLFLACQEHGETEAAEQIIKDAVKLGFWWAKAKTYGILMEACTSTNKLNEAIDLLDTMRDDGYEPNAFNYDALISSCISTNHIGKAIALYRGMLEAKVVVPLKTKIHQNLEKACRKHGEIEIADQIVKDAAKLGFWWAKPSEAFPSAKDAKENA